MGFLDKKEDKKEEKKEEKKEIEYPREITIETRKNTTVVIETKDKNGVIKQRIKSKKLNK